MDHEIIAVAGEGGTIGLAEQSQKSLECTFVRRNLYVRSRHHF